MDIARMIRSGVDVEVVDARTGEDLTRMVLTQIVTAHVPFGAFGSETGDIKPARFRAAPARFALGAPGGEAAEVELLRRRVEELETRLAKVRKPRRRSAASPKRGSKPRTRGGRAG